MRVWVRIVLLYGGLSLSLLMAIFPGESGLASFIGAKDDGGGDGWLVGWGLTALSAQIGHIVPRWRW